MDDLERASAAGGKPMEESLQMLESRQVKRSRGQNESSVPLSGELPVTVLICW